MRTDHEKNGYHVECIHSGQKRRYGDSFKEFIVITEKPAEEAEKYCTEHVYKCSLTTKEYLADERAGVKDFGDHFRANYEFSKVCDGKYFYCITEPSTH